MDALTSIATPINEPVLSYAPGSPERDTLQARLRSMVGDHPLDLPMVINGADVRTGETYDVRSPHRHRRILARAHKTTHTEVTLAINAALRAKRDWASTPWTARAAIFMRAAELLTTKYRATINAATMLGQSKTAYQAEIDAACELADFWRFNVHFASKLYTEQPISSPGVWNVLDHRPLDGFVFAITPFNFTAIAANLPTAPALMGNTVLWKPAETQSLSAHFLMEILREAGLPPGVINLVYGDGPTVGAVALTHADLGGVHFTGSTAVFNQIWSTVGQRIGEYKSYPRIVGETGGKDFIVAHTSADLDALAVAIVRGGFEFQGQKCSATSRVYVPESRWASLRERLAAHCAKITVGDVEDFSHFMSAVIDERAFRKHAAYIEHGKTDTNYELIAGGTYTMDEGYFVAPTIFTSRDPKAKLMREEIFGPVVTVHTYPESQWSETLALVDQTSPYALTGAIMANDRVAIEQASRALRFSAGNFYVNDKPSGAVVGQQPFGGSRASGTNDKAGSPLNLVRWVSPRTIKETFSPPTGDFAYPFMRSP